MLHVVESYRYKVNRRGAGDRTRNRQLDSPSFGTCEKVGLNNNNALKGLWMYYTKLSYVFPSS